MTAALGAHPRDAGLGRYQRGRRRRDGRVDRTMSAGRVRPRPRGADEDHAAVPANRLQARWGAFSGVDRRRTPTSRGDGSCVRSALNLIRVSKNLNASRTQSKVGRETLTYVMRSVSAMSSKQWKSDRMTHG